MSDLIIRNVKLVYPHLFTPHSFQNEAATYKTTILIDKKDNTMLKLIQASIDQTKQYGAKKVWNGKVPNKLNLPIKDGDGTNQNGQPYAPEYKGHYFMKLKSKNKPVVVNGGNQQITDESQIYGGVICNVAVGLSPYNFGGGQGITAYLNGVQKVKDSEAFGGSGGTMFGVLPGFEEQTPFLSGDVTFEEANSYEGTDDTEEEDDDDMGIFYTTENN